MSLAAAWCRRQVRGWHAGAWEVPKGRIVTSYYPQRSDGDQWARKLNTKPRKGRRRIDWPGHCAHQGSGIRTHGCCDGNLRRLHVGRGHGNTESAGLNRGQRQQLDRRACLLQWFVERQVRLRAEAEGQREKEGD